VIVTYQIPCLPEKADILPFEEVLEVKDFDTSRCNAIKLLLRRNTFIFGNSI